MSEPIAPRIKYIDHQQQVNELTDEEATYVLANDGDTRREWTRWLRMSGQAQLPVTSRHGSMVIVEREGMNRLLALRRKEKPSPEGGLA